MLPTFTYHPNPIATGNVKSSEEICHCCGKARGYIYTASVYGQDDPSLCPWCIADGSAAKRFDASFSDEYPLAEAGIDDEIIDEVIRRTPGYSSWQQEVWLTCCKDACAFHGDASKAELLNVEDEVRDRFLSENDLDEVTLSQILSYYEPGGDAAIYKFECLHCGRVRYGWDFT